MRYGKIMKLVEAMDREKKAVENLEEIRAVISAVKESAVEQMVAGDMVHVTIGGWDLRLISSEDGGKTLHVSGVV